QRIGIAFRPRRHRCAERRKRVGTDDPRRNTGQEILGQERPERLIFPRLQVARGPVVEKAISRNMLAGFADRDRLTEIVALPNPDTELQLVIETPAWPIFRSIGLRRLALASWPHD